MAKPKPKYSAAAFRRLLAELVNLYVARFEAQSTGAAQISKVEAQIKEICELVSPGFGDRFIDQFRNQRRSPEDRNEYLLQRSHVLECFAGSAAMERKPNVEKARQKRADNRTHRNKRMTDRFLSRESSSLRSASDLKAEIGLDYGLTRSAAIAVIDQELKKRGLKPAKPRKA